MKTCWKLVLIVIAMPLMSQAQTVKPKAPCLRVNSFFEMGSTNKQHFAFSPLMTTIATGASDSCGAFYEACDEKAGELRRNCEYRGEGEPAPTYSYTSCNCQGLRDFRRCMQDNGCGSAYALQFDMEQHPECFGIQ